MSTKSPTGPLVGYITYINTTPQMNYTLKELQARVAALIEQQGEDSVCAAWIYTGEDVIKYDEDGDAIRQPKELSDAVINSLDDYDYIYQVIDEAIEQELDWKTEGVCQMSQNF